MWPIGEDVALVGDWAPHRTAVATYRGTLAQADTGSAAGWGESRLLGA